MSKPNPPPPTFGDRLRLLRDESGLTQAELAVAAGLTITGVAMLERGERQPAWDTVVRLADALGVGVGEFRTPAENGQ